jgi:hypothetical protein
LIYGIDPNIFIANGYRERAIFMQNQNVELITQQKVATLNDATGFVESNDNGKIVLRIVSGSVNGYLKKAFEPGIRTFTSFDAVVNLGARLNIQRLEINPKVLNF